MVQKSFLLVAVLVLAGCDDILALQCRQCISFSGDTIADCAPLPSMEKVQGSSMIQEEPVDYDQIPINPKTENNENARAADDDDAHAHQDDIKVDNLGEDESTTSGAPTDDTTDDIMDNDNTVVSEEDTSSFYLCTKTSFYLRRGNHVGRIIILDGLKNHQNNGNDTTSYESTSEEDHALKSGSDGSCRYINGQNPLLTQMAEILQLEPFAYLVGAKKCFCATEYCNGDPLMR